MLGNSHIFYGIILAEIVYRGWIRQTGEDGRYSRIVFWLLGALGGWLPDMDGISGLVANAVYIHGPWSEAIPLYHREFSHGIAFLAVTVGAFAGLISWGNGKHKERKATRPSELVHPLGQVPLQKDRGEFASFGLIIVGFIVYNGITRWFAFSFILGVLVVYAAVLARHDRAFYGIVFFGAAILHQACDFLQCEWDPLGPWDPTLVIGLFWYCGDWLATPLKTTLFLVFEVGPHIVGTALLVQVLLEVKKYNSIRQKIQPIE